MDSVKEKQLREEILTKVTEYYQLIHGKKAVFHPGDRIGYAGRVFDDSEMRNLTESALDFWLTGGRWMREFEHGLAEYLGVDHVLMVNSGSSANLLAFMSLTSPLLGNRRIERGDEVITVAAAFPTTVAPIIQYGAVPVFVDVDPLTANIDCDLLEQALSGRTKAVMLAHSLGNPFDVKRIKSFCDKHGLWLVEDNCDALGSRFDGKLTGTFGDFGTSSFYPPHHITTGEGGAVYTSDPLLAKIARSMRDWGRECSCPPGMDNLCGKRFSGKFGDLPQGYDHKYVYSHFGYNLKATDMQAAVGCAQLKKIELFAAKRKENFNRLYEGLKDIPCLDLPGKYKSADPDWFGFLMTLHDRDRNELVRKLESAGIQTRNLFAGNLLKHPCSLALTPGRDFRIASAMTHTDFLMTNAFWIGVYPGMTPDRLDYMIEQIHEALV